MYLLKVQKKLCYASAIYWRVLAIYSISWALKNVILSLRTVEVDYLDDLGDLQLRRHLRDVCEGLDDTDLLPVDLLVVRPL